MIPPRTTALLSGIRLAVLTTAFLTVYLLGINSFIDITLKAFGQHAPSHQSR